MRDTQVTDTALPSAEILRVEPRRIALATQGINSKLRPDDFRKQLRDPGSAVIGGDWDNRGWRTVLRPFEELDVYQAIEHRFVDNGRWEDTAFYARVVGQIENGTPRWGCRTADEFKLRLSSTIEGLYNSIATQGYKSQSELQSRDPRDEVRVGIRRDGRFLLFDGRHRLAIARVLGIEDIPVSVIVRHPEWLEFKASIVAYANKALRGKLYQELDHPDLADLPAKHGTQRIGMLRAAIGEVDEPSTLLDIGTHWGYMCQQFEKLGFDCVGIESGKDSADFARRLATATESRYEIWEGDLLDFPASRFDVVLALSIFHHMIKTEERHRRLIDFLGRIETDLILFEPHDPLRSAAQMEGAYRNYSPDEFAAFVAQHSGLSRVEFLGRADDAYQRPIYRLTRP